MLLYTTDLIEMFGTLPMFLSTPAATAAKLGAKLGAMGSGLWHRSLRYKLFMLERETAKVTGQTEEGRLLYDPSFLTNQAGIHLT